MGTLKILKFTARWCGACPVVSETLKRVLVEFPGVEVDEINVDEQPGLAIAHHVMNLPTLIIGDRRVVGSVIASQLRSIIKEALGQ
jgi:thiol-disulfide isomerase/thioredoxin